MRHRTLKSTLRQSAILVLLITIGMAFALPTRCQAEQITINFEAKVTEKHVAFPGVEVGDLITGSYTIESTTPDSEPFPSIGIYKGVVTAMEMTFGGESHTLASGGANQLVIQDAPSPPQGDGKTPQGDGWTASEDSYFLNVDVTGSYNLQFGIYYFGGQEWSSDALPLVAPRLPSAEHNDGYYEFLVYARGIKGSPHIRATVTSLAVVESDTTPPDVTCSLAQNLLWPPNNKMATVGLNAVVQDDQDENPSVQMFVYSNEADEGAAGAALGADGSLSLRAERSGGGSGRVYLIVVVATDAAGNEGFDCCTVMVPHNQSKKSMANLMIEAALAETHCLESGTAPDSYHLIGSN